MGWIGAGFGDLPVELVQGVIEETHLSDCLALAQVSKLLNAVSTRRVYRNLDLKSPDVLVKACRSLISSPLAAQSVKRLSVTSMGPNMRFKSFYDLLQNALSRCSNVTSLAISSERHEYGLLLRKCAFPDLETFAYLNLDPEAVAFLRRHPSIRHLRIALDPSYHVVPPALTPITLPALSTLTSRSSTFPVIVPTSPVEYVNILWERADAAHMDDVLQALARSPKPIVAFTTSLRFWSSDILHSVATHLREIQFFHVVNNAFIQISPDGAYEAFVDTLKDVLPGFKRLQGISLAHVGHDLDDEPTLDTMNEDYRLANDLGKACPTLTMCSFTTNVAWRRHRWGLWMPSPRHPVSQDWFRDFLLYRSDPLLTLIAEKLEEFRADAQDRVEQDLLDVIQTLRLLREDHDLRDLSSIEDVEGSSYSSDDTDDETDARIEQEAPRAFSVPIL